MYGNQSYSWESDITVAIPFHAACREVLCRYVGIKVSEMDKDVLYETLTSLSNGDESNSLEKVNYGEITEEMGQYWEPKLGYEHLVSHPITDEALQAFCWNLPMLAETKRQASEEKKASCATEGDPFSRLANEVLTLILNNLGDMRTVYCAKEASPAFRNVELTNGWWKNHIMPHMPWLWDFQANADTTDVGQVDWKYVYRRLWFGSSGPNRRGETFYGLRNRRRIWNTTCPAIAESYASAAKKMRKVLPETLQGSMSSEQAKLLPSINSDMGHFIESFIDNFSDLPTAQPIIEVSWCKQGWLTSIHINNAGEWNKGQKRIKGETLIQNLVPIPQDDWVTGFVVIRRSTTEMTRGEKMEMHPGMQKWPGLHIIGLDILFAKGRPVHLGYTNGDKRLVYVNAGRFIVGLKTRISSKNMLGKMTLIEQDVAVHAHGCDRVMDERRGLYNEHMNHLSQRPIKMVWRGELLEPGIALHHPVFGYWSNEGSAETSGMSALVWARSEAEQAEIVSISAEVQFCGLRVTYADRPPVQAGSRFLAMKTLEIDGKNGERIIDVRVSVNHLVHSLRIMTNRGRQLVLGNPGRSERSLVGREADAHFYAPNVHTPGPDGIICGIYGFWDTEKDGNLDIMGGLSCPQLGQPFGYDMHPDPRDHHNFPWEPQAPPRNLVETGPIFGEREPREGEKKMFSITRERIPAPGCFVSWLDCSRPVNSIHFTTVHGTVSPQLNLSALTLVYTDGSYSSVGPTRFPEEPSCGWCQLGHCKKEEIEKEPHYRHYEWKVDAKLVTGMRFWTNVETRTLTAMQVLIEGGRDSPVLQHWGRKPILKDEEVEAVLVVGNNQGEMVTGIKVFMENNGRNVTRDDTIITAYQALKTVGSPCGGF